MNGPGSIAREVKRLERNYGRPEVSMPTYAGLATGFNAAMVLLAIAARRRSVRRHSDGMADAAIDLPLREVALLAIASFRLSRLIARDKVTSFIRAPFVQYRGNGDAPGEVDEQPQGHGFRKVLGELVTCPYCLEVWTAGALGALLLLRPYEGRVATRLLSAVAGADLLQESYITLNAERARRS